LQSADPHEVCLTLYGLRGWLDPHGEDVAFDPIMLVVSENDALPIGPQREFWSEEARLRKGA
jgi:hypothetical protein